MRRIILIIGNTETLSYFSKELAIYLTSLGREVFIWDMTRPAESVAAFEALDDKRNSLLVTFNFIGLNGEGQFGGSFNTIWEQHGIEMLSIMVDSPIYYYRQLTAGYVGLSVACIDRNHARYVRRWHPYIENVYFCPLCGNEPILDYWINVGTQGEATDGKASSDAISLYRVDRDPIPFEKRPLDMVFIANYVTKDGIRGSIEGADKEYRDFLHDICAQMIDEPQLVLEDTLYDRLLGEFPDEKKDSFSEAMFHCIYVDLYVRSHFRAEAVRALADAGFKVYCIGQDWDKLECEHPENIIHSNVMLTSADCVRTVENAKISLNVMPHFKAGTHDRIFTSMLAGSVSLTDGSEYLDEVITPWEDYAPWTLGDTRSLVEAARRITDDTELAERIATAGRLKAMERFTWLGAAELIDGLG